jgi:outer membrane usher protein
MSSVSMLAAPCHADSSSVFGSFPGWKPGEPAPDERLGELRLHLELVVNGLPTGRIIGVVMEGSHLFVSARDLREAGIDHDWPSDRNVDLLAEPHATTVYSQADQRLLLTVPPEWLPEHRISAVHRQSYIKPTSDFGALVNYDVYLANSQGGTSGSVQSEVRVFGGFGTIRNAGSYRFELGSDYGEKHPYIRYDTAWTYVDDQRTRTYEAGDLVTRTLPWTSPVRLGGAQVSRDFSVRPDVVTYPLPILSGSATVPSALDLYVNGYRAASTSVEPGPFIVDELPYVNGAGEAVMVTTDAQGKQVRTSVPFYVANTLLRPGLADYAFAFGKLRRSFGARSFSYGEPAGTASGRLGVTDFLTVEATAEAAGGHHLIGVGGVIRIGNLGVIDASASHSRENGRDGRQLTLGYQFSGRRFSLMARTVRRSRTFGDLSTFASPSFRLPTHQVQAQANLVLGERLGNIATGYVETRRDDERFRLVNLSYYKPLWGSSRSRPSRWCNFGCGRGPSSGGFGGDV